MSGTPEFSSLREKIAWEKVERAKRYADFEQWVREADSAGLEAGRDCKPDVMVVREHSEQFDDSSPVKQQWTVPEGVCGFAWIRLSQGNSSFAVWAKKHAGFSKRGMHGICRWVPEFGQSYDRKTAYAHAYAEILRDHGIQCFARGRVD